MIDPHKGSSQRTLRSFTYAIDPIDTILKLSSSVIPVNH